MFIVGVLNISGAGLSPRHGLSLPEAAAQLCWWHRWRTGILKDEERHEGWRTRSFDDTA